MAYARVGLTGLVDDALNMTSANVTHPTTGLYCISGLSFTPKNVQVTPQYFGSTASAYLGNYGGCPTAQISVNEMTDGGGSPDTQRDSPFMILIN
ncbi:MAG: hypothetical protein WCB67_04175 [Solirubrobacteraceae bacterium]